jgi:hypothetical protein
MIRGATGIAGQICCKLIEPMECEADEATLLIGCWMPRGERLLHNVIPGVEDKPVLRWRLRMLHLRSGGEPPPGFGDRRAAHRMACGVR